MLKILSQQQNSISHTISYAIPYQWQEYIHTQNQHLVNLNDLITTNLININDFVQSIELKEKETFINLVTQKVKFLDIDHFVFSPKLKINTQWKTVSNHIYQVLKKKIGSVLQLPLIIQENLKTKQENTIKILQGTEFKKIKLLICSLTQNHLFYGYVSKNITLQMAIKEILIHFEYFYNSQTKITFLQTNQFLNFNFQQFKFENGKEDDLIMIHGLERYDEYVQEDQYRKEEFQQDYYRKESFQQDFFPHRFQSPRHARIQRNGEQLTMADQDSRTISEHTMSTGAQTPITFLIQDQDLFIARPYQNYGLFGERILQEIQHMKQYARQTIYTDIIEVPAFNLEYTTMELSKLAEDIEQNILKRMIYNKDLVKDVKESWRESKQTYVSNKKKDINLKQSRESGLQQKIDAQNKNKYQQKATSVVHFSFGTENN